MGADGGSTDSTLEILKNAVGLNVSLTSQADFGIYDAPNRAIKLSKGHYYIVIRADDEKTTSDIISNIIKNPKKFLETREKMKSFSDRFFWDQ